MAPSLWVAGGRGGFAGTHRIHMQTEALSLVCTNIGIPLPPYLRSHTSCRYTTEGGKTILDEMARLARPGGLIVFHCPEVSWPAYSAAADRLEKDGMWR